MAKQSWNFLRTVFIRWRYPVSMPEDVADALGVTLSNLSTFQEFLSQLSSPRCRPTKLNRFMPREDAEEVFQTALRKERFCRNTLFSYYFNEGWMEFILEFDDQSRLRRMYVQCNQITAEKGIEIPLR